MNDDEHGQVGRAWMQTDIERAVTRMAHQILEANKGADETSRSWASSREATFSRRCSFDKIEEIEGGSRFPWASLDISFYRDDFADPPVPRSPRHRTSRFRIDGKTVVLVDDVLYTRPHHPRRARRPHGHRAAPPPCAACGAPLTAATASCPSAPTTWVKTSPRRASENVRLFLEEVDGTSAAVEILDIEAGRPRAGAAAADEKEGE